MKRLALFILLVPLITTGAASGQAGDVEVVLEKFGVGDSYRPGDYAAVRLKLSVRQDSALDEATNVWVHWDMPNADGDIAEFGRTVALTKGGSRSIWLYAPIPPDALSGDAWPVRVYDFKDGKRGRELGGMRISPPGTSRVQNTSSMIGVVGTTQMGINQLTLGQQTGGAVFTAHENTRGIFNIRPEDLPDRWEGLRGFEAIVWSDRIPQDLPISQAEALREWIRRGGHLVISLPEDTNPWGLGEIGRTELEDLLPTQAPEKVEDVALSRVLPILCKGENLLGGVDFPVNIHVFKELYGDLDLIDNEYEPLIALRDGRVVVIQRLFGHGRVTIVGLDLSKTRFSALPLPNGTLTGLPQADIFWNRILGRRADTPSTGELTKISKEERLARGTPSELDTDAGGGVIRQQINMGSDAAAGLMMALMLFLGYWIAAGPGGFYALKHYKRQKHSWVAFAGAAAVFTAIAWGGVQLLRKSDVKVTHLTVLDHVARPAGWPENPSDPQLQRGVSWLTVYVPGYSSTPIGIESMEAQPPVPAQRDLLVSWTPPRDPDQKFPNADRYAVDVGREPDEFTVPARSTSTQLHADWLGGVDPAWGGLLREDPGDPIRVLVESGQEVLTGTIINDLPGQLHDVTMIWVKSQRVTPRRYATENRVEQAWIEPLKSGTMLNSGSMWKEATLDPGVAYRIPALTPAQRLGENIYQLYVRPFEGRASLGSATGSGGLRDSQWRQRIEMLSLFHQLRPPKYLRPPGGQSPESMMSRRTMGREIDLSAWFSRPCLIVIGYLDEVPCPIPLRVDGEEPTSVGTTIVRWIYPLPLIESIAFPKPAEEEEEGL